MSAQAVKQQLKALQADNEGRPLSTSQQAAKKKDNKNERKPNKNKQQSTKQTKTRAQKLASKSGAGSGGEATRRRNLKSFINSTQASQHNERVDMLMRKALGLPEKPKVIEETDEDLLAWFG